MDGFLKTKFIYSFACLLVMAGSCKKGADEPVTTPKPTEKPAVVISTDPPVIQFGQLKVQGNKILDKNNKPVQLRGMSLFWSQWEGEFYNESLVKWLKNDWRCTVVRASMGVGMPEGGYLKYPAAEKQKVIAVVEAAIKEGLYVIIDWHDHTAEQNTEASKAFFSEMAERFGDKPNVIYEIYNEPLDVSWVNVIKPYSEAVIAAIRAKDPDNLVICGTRNWSQQIEEPANNPINDVNVAYSLHFYAASHKQWLRDRTLAALNKGIAVFVTEFGTSEASGNGTFDQTETNNWFTFLDQHKISWCNWSVADKTETSAALKPGASGTGGWTESQLSPSGIFIRQHLRTKNP
ncbi:MAG: glycoside hydrolase family 5 protein [Sphingobacteriaceae bacterium]|nr:glycoside hydrolase family 5 protein [Sphingobacteriaceae bacterium]